MNYKIGLMGCGVIASYGHLPAIMDTDGLSIHALWCAQWVAFCGMWSRITPEAIQAMHERLTEEQSAQESQTAGPTEDQRDAKEGLREPFLRPSGGSE